MITTTKFPTFDGLTLKDATFVRQSFPPHFHEEFSIGFVERGVECLSVGGATLVVPARHVVVINSGDVHAHGAFDEAPWRYRVAYVSPDVLDHVAREAGVAPGARARFHDVMFDDHELYRRLRDVHAGGAALGPAPLRSALARLVALQRDRPARPRPGPSAAMLAAAAYIREHFAERLPVEVLAARFRMDRYRFARSFKQSTGLTPSSYQMVHRVNHAQRLLAAGAPVADAAQASGFYDQSHLVRHFKRFTGTSPSQYRRGCTPA